MAVIHSSIFPYRIRSYHVVIRKKNILDCVISFEVIFVCDVVNFHFLAECLGSGDGERKTLLTQMAIEPLLASVLFALALAVDDHA